MEAYIAEDAKQYNPEEENQDIPDEDEWYADYGRDEVKDSSEGCERGYYFCVYLLDTSQLLLFSLKAAQALFSMRYGNCTRTYPFRIRVYSCDGRIM